MRRAQGRFVHEKPAGFRVWHKGKQKYVTDIFDFAMNCDGCLIVFDDHGHGRICDDKWELELFTGLWDSEGKPVFEGDILEAHFWAPSAPCGEAEDANFTGEVVWMNGPEYYGYVIQADDTIQSWSETWMPFEHTSHFETGEGITVVGNKNEARFWNESAGS